MELIYQCISCHQVIDEEELPEHLLLHLEGKLCNCSLCVRGFDTEQGLVKHLLTHVGSSLCVVNAADPPFVGQNMPKAAQANDRCKERRPANGGVYRRKQPTQRGRKRQPRQGSRQSTPGSVARKKQPARGGVNRKKTSDWTHEESELYEESEPWRCVTCSETFPTAEAVTQHLATHIASQCSRCEINFDTEQDLRVHMKTQHHVYYHCTYCGEGFQESQESHKHRNSKCKICGTRFVCASHLTAHEATHTGATPHKCDICAKVFTQWQSLLDHQQKCKRKTHVCQHCAKGYTSRPALNKHLESHQRDYDIGPALMPSPSQKRPKAARGGNTSRRSPASMDRLLRRRPDESKPWTCATCSQTFATAEEVTQHLSTQHMETDFVNQCSRCDLKFETESELQLHMESHPLLVYHCVHCGDSFNNEWDRYKHRKAKCQICGTLFICESHLTIHAASHTGDVPHKCEICGKVFTQAKVLLEHKVKNHKEIQICVYCGRTYSTAGNLRSHLDLDHREQYLRDMAAANQYVKHPHTCKVCGEGFNLRIKLQAHSLTHDFKL